MKSRSLSRYLSLSFTCLLASFTCLSTLQPHAHAHNGAILVQANDGKLVTGLDSVITGVQTIGERAFSLQFPSSLGSNVPAFSSLGNPPAGSETLPVDGDVNWDFLPMTHAGVTSNLLYWDGIGTTIQDVEFGAVPGGDAKLTLYTEGFFDNAFIDGSPDFVDGKHIGSITNDATQPLHAHRWFFMETVSGAPPETLHEGVYLFAMQLRMEGFENTEPFYIAAGTDTISFNTLDQLAVPWVEDHLDTLVAPDTSGSGDVDTNGDYDGADFLRWQREIGTPEVLADWQANYGNTAVSVAATSVPEPRSLLLIVLTCSLYGLLSPGWRARA